MGVKNGLFRSVLMLLRILALLRVSSNLNAGGRAKAEKVMSLSDKVFTIVSTC